MFRNRQAMFLAVALLALLVFLFSRFPAVYALTCQVQITGIDVPQSVAPSTTIQVNTNARVTCGASQVATVVKAEIVDLASGASLSSNSVNLGYVGSQEKTFNVTIPNSVQVPSLAGAWKLRSDVSVIVTDITIASGSQPFEVQVGGAVQEATGTVGSSVSETTATSKTFGHITVGGDLTLAAAGAAVAAVAVASILVFTRRKKAPGAAPPHASEAVLLEEPKKAEPKSVPTARAPALQNISTGYAELDSMLAGGVPVGYSILLVSPPCDEKDLLFRRIIESGISLGTTIFYVSRDIAQTEDLSNAYQRGFYAFNPQSEKIPGDRANLFKMSGLENLIDVNISLSKAMEPFLKKNENKILLLDILSDVLLQHKALTARRWLDDFLGKRKAEGFTVIGTLNPLLTSKTESQTIIDLFDGIIEIYERELGERSRRFLVVKKMYGRKYQETELMLDKNKLF